MIDLPNPPVPPASPPVAVVSQDNRFLRWADRREVHAKRLPHRSIQVLVFNAARELLVQKRHRDKLTFPSHWDVSCAGHVEFTDYVAGPDERLDEVYASVAKRELFEELGVSPALTFLGHFGPEPGVHYEHLHLYSAEHEGPFVCQPDEVEQVKFVTPEALDALMANPEEKVCSNLLWFFRWIRASR